MRLINIIALESTEKIIIFKNINKYLIEKLKMQLKKKKLSKISTIFPQIFFAIKYLFLYIIIIDSYIVYIIKGGRKNV